MTVKRARPGEWGWMAIGYVLVLLLVVALGALLYRLCSGALGWPPLTAGELVLGAMGAWSVLCLLCPVVLLAWDRLGRDLYGRMVGALSATSLAHLASIAGPASGSPQPLADYLLERYGRFWRRKVRLLLVIGEPAAIEAIAPGLAAQQWLEGQGTVLLWGGNAQAGLAQAFAEQWGGLSRWRALDGAVWALRSGDSAEGSLLAAGVRQVQQLARRLRWQLPLFVWQVCDSEWPQAGRPAGPVGCRLPARFDEQRLQERLQALLEPLRREGLAQMNAVPADDFLLRLGRDLQGGGIARWRDVLAPLAGEFARGVPLRGLWFSLPVQPVNQAMPHDWPAAPAWHGIVGDPAGGQRLGWSGPRVGYGLALGAAALWGVGLLLSAASNRAQLGEVRAPLAVLAQPGSHEAQQLQALGQLVRELARLDYRVVHGVPWYQRFGLDQSPAVRAALWPRYVEANHRLVRDPAADALRRQLAALVRLPAGGEQRAERAREGHEQLKAYLMLARPHRAEADFLAGVLAAAEPSRAGVSAAVWQSVSPTLWQFYAAHLLAHPGWAIEGDATLVTQARHVLLGQLGQRTAQGSLYQRVLEEATHHFPPLTLEQMVGETDAASLLATTASVPGVFTRQAWDAQVRQAIDEIAQARREEIDWVLSDSQHDIAAELSPQALREELIERYFGDYTTAWLAFLNSVRWQQANSLAQVIDQLTLMTDARQSPLIALLNTVAYHGQAGTHTPALADSLVKSAQQLLAQDKVPAIEPLPPPSHNPLEPTFGPLLSLLGKDADGQADSQRLSVQAFVTQVTRVRLMLQQVSQAPDPQAMTQALAQTVFQGKRVDLTDTQAYGSLLAASLGAEWRAIGDTLFVQPLENAWQRVLQPSAAGLNSQWQRAIVDEWQRAFGGRYPFADTASDASLPMLGQMIRADSGRIEQFLNHQLSGVLRKEGSRWVADPRHSQGLRLHPAFLAAINHLCHLADVLYTDGGMGMSFALQGKPMRDVVQTTWTLNGQTHHYFNQREHWQRFTWPGRSDYPGARLSWTSVQSGERLFGDFSGNWGLIRLLEKAQATALDDVDSHYRLTLAAPDGLNLVWHLRTELGAGPLALLTLRDFVLPGQVFVVDGMPPDEPEGRRP